jgi:hypothetical protein
MAEGVEVGLGTWSVAGPGDEVLGRGAERDEGVPILDRTDADAARCHIAGAAGHVHAGSEAELPGESGPYPADYGRTLDQVGHLPHREPARRQKLGRPVAPRLVEPQGSGRVGKVRDMLARELQPDEVLGQQHACDARRHRRLVGAEPEQLGCGQPRHGRDTGDAPEPRHPLLEEPTLGFSPGVVPQDGGAQHPIGAVEQHRTVHLPGQAQRPNRAQLVRPLGAQAGQDRARGGPPVGRVLLGPERPRSGDGQRLLGLA